MTRQVRAWLTALGLALVASGTELAPARALEAQGPARADVERYMAARGLSSPLSVHVFYGDFTGDGVPDALAVIYTHIEGSASGFDITVASFRNEGGRFVHHRDHENVFGTSPRQARFSPGRIVLTTSVLGPNDARCCPTGQRRWTIATGAPAPRSAAIPAPAAVARPEQFTGIFTQDRTCQEQYTRLHLAPGRMVISLSSDEFTVPIRFTGCEGAVCSLASTGDRRRWTLRLISDSRIAIRGPIYDTTKSDRAELTRCG